MIQKIIAYLYQKKVTKTYNDNNDGFICNFVLEYKDKKDFVHKMACYAVNFEPVVIGKENRYLVERPSPDGDIGLGASFSPLPDIYSRSIF